MHKKLLTLVGLGFVLTPARAGHLHSSNASFQNYTSIDVRPVETKPLKYGESMKLVFEGKRKNGKVRKFSGDNHKFDVMVEGAAIKHNTISVAGFPADKNLRYVKVKIKGRARKDLADSLIIPLDFKHGYHLDVSGEDGQRGKNGLQIYDKNGASGDPGENGKDLVIRIWSEKDLFSGEDLYVLEISKTLNKQKFYWCYMPNSDSIKIVSNGGNGGEGRDGARGNNGRKGKIDPETGEVTLPEAGEDGGDGGDGGNGGNGGNIDVQVDEHSVEVLQYIRVQNKGGKGGSHGYGKRGGRAGRPGGTGEYPPDGEWGHDGYNGISGSNGYYHIRVVKI